MLIDWFTVIAQVLNFLVLVWLLKKFLYRPILDAMDKREERVSAKRIDADRAMTEAQREQLNFQQKSVALEQKRTEILAQAANDAKTERQGLLFAAKKESEVLRANWRHALVAEQKNTQREMIDFTQREVYAVARKVLTDLAGASLEERISEVFIHRLRGLSGVEQQRLSGSQNNPATSMIVRSAFDLSPAQRADIEHAIQEITGSSAIHFQTTPALISGIELTIDGYKVAWSIGDYISSLEKHITEHLAQFATQETPN